MKALADEKGVKMNIVGVDKEGFIDFGKLQSSLDGGASIVSIQHANQEIGTIQDIAKIGKICRDKGVLFHTDASHSFLKLPIDVQKMNVDLMTLSAHNIYGPKGVGALYIRKGVEIAPLIYGGGEQKGVRPGLEDVPSIVGFGKAAEAYDMRDNQKMAKLRDQLIGGLLKVKDSKLNGPRGEKRLCNNVNVTFKYIEGESILLHLDMRGIAVTTGSACFSRDLTPSHVIIALGMSHGDAHGSVRFSLSKYNTKDQMDYVAKNAAEVVEKLREISPIK
jgi:cysteine desulfurase